MNGSGHVAEHGMGSNCSQTIPQNKKGIFFYVFLFHCAVSADVHLKKILTLSEFIEFPSSREIYDTRARKIIFWKFHSGRAFCFDNLIF